MYYNMENIFDIVEKIDSIIILNVMFGDFNVSIGSNSNFITVIINSDKCIKIYETNIHHIKKYHKLKRYICSKVNDSKFINITGFSSIENKKLLSNFFVIKENLFTDLLINIYKGFT